VSFNQYVTAILAEAVGERKATSVEQPVVHSDLHSANLIYGEYFLEGNYEPVPCDFQLVDFSSVRQQSSSAVLLKSLARLSAQLPDKIELKSKATKYDDKRHTSFGVC
jgi:hypothetical protein